ncbi:hypothetical protein GCM10023189_20150 [Nibrella saemangeumensis]|uniref:Uncharacterized protein n=1 Tax=Nibrella saemangeumensis TaxID=1084526 RepID=A0ABP8MSF3_9BACT
MPILRWNYSWSGGPTGGGNSLKSGQTGKQKHHKISYTTKTGYADRQYGGGDGVYCGYPGAYVD